MGMKKKIFIVDDDIAIHRLIAAVISSDVFEIIQALNGLKAGPVWRAKPSISLMILWLDNINPPRVLPCPSINLVVE